MIFKKPFAYFFSIAFHPLVLPTYAAIIIVTANPKVFNYLNIDSDILLLRTVLNTLIFPAVIILIALPLGFIKSLQMEEREERIVPYITTLFFYIWAFFSFYNEGVTPNIFNVIMLGSLLALVISFMANVLFMKISIHTVGMGVLIGLLLAMIPSSEKNIIPVLLIAILIAGAVGTSRLILNSHTPKEIYLGYLIGLFSQFVAIQFLY